MIVYLTAMIFSIFFAFMAQRLLKDKRKELSTNSSCYIVVKKNITKPFICALMCFFSFLPLFLVSAFRYNVGTDYAGTYTNIFYIILNGHHIRDIGYELLVRFSLIFSSSPAGPFFWSSLLIAVFIYLSIFQQSENPCYSIFLYLATTSYFISMNAVRQAIAIAIFLYSLRFIVQKKMVKYFACILVATAFHTTAIIFLPLYFINKVHSIKKIVLSFGIACLFLPTINSLIKRLFINNSFLSTFFAWYYNSKYNNQQLPLFSFLIITSILILAASCYQQWKNDQTAIVYFVLNLIGLFFLLCNLYTPLMQRMYWYTLFSEIIYLPMLIRTVISSYAKVILYLTVTVCFLTYMYLTIVVQGYHEVLPYQTIFST